jgi:4-amino-4-deoxy-L-arabinose transferase-like glycosyltransferase
VNDLARPTTDRRHPGRIYLVLGLLALLVGPLLYFVQLRASVLIAPWYVPLLATLSLGLVAVALVRSRSVWRWVTAALCTFFAAAEWVMLLVLLSAPAYTGHAKAGQPFPAFTTTLANGSTFDQERLKGDKNTVMVFFRGRW